MRTKEQSEMVLSARPEPNGHGAAPRPRARKPYRSPYPFFTRTHLLLLAGITLIAAMLRLHQLGEWALWVDEAHTYRDVVAPDKQFWSSNIRNYPLSYLMLRALCSLGMPTSEGWLRLPFTFFGIMSVPALALVGRNLVGPRAALVAAVLLAVSPWHIFWSQSARAYAMVLFFALMAAVSFYEGTQRRSIWMLGVAMVMTVVAGLCHPSAYILLGGLLTYGIVALRERREDLTLQQKWMPLIVLVLLAVITVIMLPLLEHVRRVKPDFSLAHLTQTLVFFVRAPLIVAAIGGVLLLFDRADRAAPFLLWWIVVPVLTLSVLASGISKVTAQYAFYTLPAFCLAASVVVVALADRVPAHGFRGVLLRVVPLGILLLDMAGHTFLYFEKYHGERPRWREAANFVMAQPGDVKWVYTTNGPSMRYYLDPVSFTGRPGATQVRPMADYMLEAAGGGEAFMARELARAKEQGVEMFVVVTEPELYEMDKTIDPYLRWYFRARRRLPNWTGPKDMTVMVYSATGRSRPGEMPLVPVEDGEAVDPQTSSESGESETPPTESGGK